MIPNSKIAGVLNTFTKKNAPTIIILILRVQKTKNVLSSRRMKLYCTRICLIRRHTTIGQLIFIVYKIIVFILI